MVRKLCLPTNHARRLSYALESRAEVFGLNAEDTFIILDKTPYTPDGVMSLQTQITGHLPGWMQHHMEARLAVTHIIGDLQNVPGRALDSARMNGGFPTPEQVVYEFLFRTSEIRERRFDNEPALFGTVHATQPGDQKTRPAFLYPFVVGAYSTRDLQRLETRCGYVKHTYTGISHVERSAQPIHPR